MDQCSGPWHEPNIDDHGDAWGHSRTRQSGRTRAVTWFSTRGRAGGPHGPDANLNSTYIIPFFGLDQTGATDPEVAKCGGAGGSSGAGGSTGAGGSSGSVARPEPGMAAQAAARTEATLARAEVEASSEVADWSGAEEHRHWWEHRQRRKQWQGRGAGDWRQPKQRRQRKRRQRERRQRERRQRERRKRKRRQRCE